MIPTTFGGEFFQMQTNFCFATIGMTITPIGVASIDEPTTFNAHRIVAKSIVDYAFGFG